jgi:hypothetical protein
VSYPWGYVDLILAAHIQQLIFTTESGASFESLSVPLHSILTTRFEQPTFGANYLAFEIRPSSEGGLTDGTRAELRFKDRAMFDFVSLLEKTRERVIYMKRQAAEDSELDGLRTSLQSLGFRRLRADSLPLSQQHIPCRRNQAPSRWWTVYQWKTHRATTSKYQYLYFLTHTIIICI